LRNACRSSLRKKNLWAKCREFRQARALHPIVRTVVALLLLTVPVLAQTCMSAADMEPSVRTALETAAKRFFDMSARGDAAALKQNSVSSLAASFAGVESALKDNQPALSGASASVRPPFLLNAEGAGPLAHAEFLCGVFGPSGQTSHSAVFALNDLPPGKYAVTVLDISGGKKPLTLTLVLEQIGTEWKLAGYYARSQQACGHDFAWFAQQAREFKVKSQNHNAWLYYRQAIALASPVDFMSTQATDKLYDEVQSVQPADMPTDGNALDLTAGGKTYRWTAIFALPVGDDLDVVVKYATADISNTQKTFEENTQVIKTLAAKFPELKTAFAGVVARAVAPSGEDYGSLLPTKEIK
jgi:hypothetical protein